MTEFWDVLRRAEELAQRGEEFALATVVWRQGPSSGHTGSRALITAAGQLHGWIGGACAEPVVVREAQRVIADRTAKLLLLGSAEQFGDSVPEGMVPVAISCQSEGAMQVYIEPVIPTPQLTIVGRSPMAHTLADLARALGWQADVCDGADLPAADLSPRSVVIVATQGHGDEDAIERAVSAAPAFVGLVASRRRGEAVLGYLADRGVPRHLLDRVHVPVGLDLGHTTHREIAVAVLAQLVRLRAAGGLLPTAAAPPPVAEAAPGPASPGLRSAGSAATGVTREGDATEATGPARAERAPFNTDPVCGMTVRADASSHPVERDGVTYYFCCVGCRDAFLSTQEA